LEAAIENVRLESALFAENLSFRAAIVEGDGSSFSVSQITSRLVFFIMIASILIYSNYFFSFVAGKLFTSKFKDVPGEAAILQLDSPNGLL
jgi:hypothetical protein